MMPLRTAAGRLVPALLAIVLVGCSSSTPPPKPAALTEFQASLPVQTVWRTSVGRGRDAFLQPAVAENAIYAANAEGMLSRIDPQNGTLLWQVPTEASIAAGVGSDGYVVAVASARGEVLAYNAEGKPLWRAQSPSDVVAPPLVGRSLVIVRSTDHRVTAYEAESGKRRWTFQRQMPPLTLRASTEMVFAGDNVLIGLPGGRLVAVALSNGAVRWEAPVSEPKGTTEVERLNDVVGPVAAAADQACAASFQGRLVCVDAASGAMRWSRNLSARGGVSTANSAVYAVDTGSNVQAFTADGASLWRNDRLANRGVTTPLALRDGAVVGDFEGYVHFLGKDGAFAARQRIDSSAIVARPQRWADGVVVLTQDGTLALLNAQR
jgi:outer membrane protein assembly factor BamB